MAARHIYCDSIMEHCTDLGLYDIKCNVDQCKLISKKKQHLEAHLFHTHNIFTLGGNFIWGDESSPINRYFTHKCKYIAKCTICPSVYRVYSKTILLEHLERHEEVIDKIQREITCSWVSKHFTVNPGTRTMTCNHCSHPIKIVQGINFFKIHLYNYHNKHSESSGRTGYYNVDATIQQPVTEENYASTSSHHDNRHRQTSGNQGDQQRSAPSTSTSMSDNNFHGIVQHRNETETYEQMKLPEQETGIANFNIELEDEDFEMYNPDFEMYNPDFDSETDLSDLLQSSKSKDVL